MGRFVHRVEAFALALGAPGLFLIAFLDSSIFSLPEIADLLVIWMVIRNKSRVVLYVVCATLGSITGCLLLYYLGRKGGEALVRRRFSNAAVDRTFASFRRHGVLAVLIPSVLPPPAPFKVFVLLAGLAGITPGRFTGAIAIGRGARYLVEGLLAIRYGDRAIAFMQDHAATASIVVAVLLVAALLGSIAWAKAAGRKGR